MSNPILGLISGAGGLFSTALANQANRDITEQTNLMNVELTHQSWANAEAQAEAADQRTRNLYNDLYSPAALRQQLEDAGLSVGLMYGKGGIGGSGQIGAQAQTPSPIPMQSAKMESVLDAQVAALLANAKKTEAEAEEHQAGAEEKRGNLGVQAETINMLKKEQEHIDQQIKESQEQIEVMVAEIAKKNAETGNIEANTALTKQMEAFKKAETDLLNIDLSTRAAMNEATLNEMNEKIKTYKAEQAKLYAEAKKAKVDASILEKSAEYIVNNYRNEMYKSGLEAKYLVPAQVESLKNSSSLEEYKSKLKKMKYDFIKKHGFNEDYDTWYEAFRQAMIDAPTLFVTKIADFN